MIDRLQAATDALLDWAATPWRQAALVTLFAFAVLVPGLAALPVTDRDEARFVQASKQMIETGDLVDIRFQDQPRWKKPAGIYWLQAGAASLFGGANAPIWAYRLPSVLGAWLAALLTLWAARPLVGPRAALAAGVMTATMLLLAAEGNIAKTDAALAGSAAAALGGLAHVFFGRGGRGAALVFWAAIAVSILLKGPIVPAIAAFALAALWWHRDTRPRFRALRPLAGLALVIVATAPWLIAIWQVSDGAFFAESLGRDMGAKLTSGQERHWGPPGLYLALVWITLWPWAALLPLAAGWALGQRRVAWGLMLLAWIVPFWLVLEAVPTKLPHYVLPLYPAIAILLGAWLTGRPGPAGRPLRWTAAALAALPPVLAALALTTAAVYFALVDTAATRLSGMASPWIATVLAVLAAALAITGARALLGNRPLAYMATGIGAAALLYAALLQFALPRLTFAFPSPAMATAISQLRPCASGPAFSVGYHEPSLVFLTETGIRMADPTAALDSLDNDPGTMLLITSRWREILGTLPDHTVRASFRYFNYNRGKIETADLVTPEHPRWAACLP